MTDPDLEALLAEEESLETQLKKNKPKVFIDVKDLLTPKMDELTKKIHSLIAEQAATKETDLKKILGVEGEVVSIDTDNVKNLTKISTTSGMDYTFSNEYLQSMEGTYQEAIAKAVAEMKKMEAAAKYTDYYAPLANDPGYKSYMGLVSKVTADSLMSPEAKHGFTGAAMKKNPFELDPKVSPLGTDLSTYSMNQTGPWDLTFLHQPEALERWNKDEAWRELWPDIDESIDPCQSAADNYLLFGIANNSFVDIVKRYYPEPDEIRMAGELLEATDEAIEKRIAEVEAQANEDPTLKLEEFNRIAEVQFHELIERLDVSFRQYVHMACGGEMRHGSEMKTNPFYNGSRRTAWAQWALVYEKYGPESLKQMSEVFLGFSNGGFGGPRWAAGSDILYEREMGLLGPDEFTNKQIFVDRVFTLEHNGGCFLNKLSWSNNRNGTPYSEAFHYMKDNVLKAHCENPVDIQTLFNYASEKVRTLLTDYFAIALQYNLEINGLWDGKAPETPAPVAISSTGPTFINWDEEPTEVKWTDGFSYDQIMNYGITDAKLITSGVSQAVDLYGVHYQISPTTGNSYPYLKDHQFQLDHMSTTGVATFCLGAWGGEHVDLEIYFDFDSAAKMIENGLVAWGWAIPIVDSLVKKGILSVESKKTPPSISITPEGKYVLNNF